MMVDIEKLRALLEVLTEKDIAEFEHEDEVTRIRVVRGARRGRRDTPRTPRCRRLADRGPPRRADRDRAGVGLRGRDEPVRRDVLSLTEP